VSFWDRVLYDAVGNLQGYTYPNGVQTTVTKISRLEKSGRRRKRMSENQAKIDALELVRGTFMSYKPRISKVPHVIVQCGRKTLGAISTANGSLLGLWGERPMFRMDGKHYLEPPDSRITDDFALWKSELNQRYLLERACVGPQAGFKMFISADTPVPVLARTYERFPNSGGAPSFADYIEHVCEWLAELRWALIPFEGELGWCIFATSQVNTLQRVKAELEGQLLPLAHLLENGDQAVWVHE
jgi:hypothetical protein